MSVATCRLKIPIVSSPLRILSRFLAESWIGVGKSAYHQQSQDEIGSDNPCYRHLSEIQMSRNPRVIPCSRAATCPSFYPHSGSRLTREL
jgi:hypothetical protein